MAMPPSAPPPGSPPPAAQADPMAGMQQRAQQMAAAIPPAVKPFPAAAVQSVVDAFNDAKEALIPHIKGEMPMPKSDMDGRFSRLPPEVYVPAALLLEEMAGIEPGAEKYKCDPETLKDVSGLRTLAGKLSAVAKDKKVKAAVEAKMAPPEEEEVTMDEESVEVEAPEKMRPAAKYMAGV